MAARWNRHWWLVVLALAAVLGGAFAGCDDGGDDGNDTIVVDDDDDDDATGDDDDDSLTGEEYRRCQDAFNFLTAECNAQFVDGSGNVLTQNQLLAECPSDAGQCVVSCYEEIGECGDAIKACLAEDCRL